MQHTFSSDGLTTVITVERKLRVGIDMDKVAKVVKKAIKKKWEGSETEVDLGELRCATFTFEGAELKKRILELDRFEELGNMIGPVHTSKNAAGTMAWVTIVFD